MRKLTAMRMKLVMDRDIDPAKHYICPGGYEVNGKNFDFNYSMWDVCNEEPNKAMIEVSDLDSTLGIGDYEGVEIEITADDLKEGFTEFYVYTGEQSDPIINPITIEKLELCFDDMNWESVSTDLLESANKAMCGSQC